MKSEFMRDIMSLLNKNEIKAEMDTISKYVTSFILTKLNPYMYIIITILVILFLTNVITSILIILLWRKCNHNGTFI